MIIERNDEDWLKTFVPYLIFRITSQLNLRLRKNLRRCGINITRWRVLALLEDQVRLNIGQIAKITLIEQPTVSRIVDQLEREGLAARESGGEDSRFVEVTLTPAGDEAFRQIYPIARQHQELVLMGFKRQEIKALIGFLERIQTNISSSPSIEK